MLVYARIILALMLLSAAFQVIGGVLVFAMGGIAPGLVMFLIGCLFAWLAYTNFQDATACALSENPKEEPKKE